MGTRRVGTPPIPPRRGYSREYPAVRRRQRAVWKKSQFSRRASERGRPPVYFSEMPGGTPAPETRIPPPPGTAQKAAAPVPGPPGDGCTGPPSSWRSPCVPAGTRRSVPTAGPRRRSNRTPGGSRTAARWPADCRAHSPNWTRNPPHFPSQKRRRRAAEGRQTALQGS